MFASMKTIRIIFFCFTIFKINAQERALSADGIELAGFEYILTPSLGDIQLEKTSFRLGFGKRMKSSALMFGLTYDKYNLTFSGTNLSVGLDDFEDLHSLRLNLMFRKPMKNNWTLGASISPAISSTLLEPLSNKDFVFNSFVNLNKAWVKNELKSRLSFGLGFGTLFGSPRLFPIISYYKELSEKSSFNVGLPSTGYYHKINSRNSIEFTINPQGFFSNNSSSIIDSENGKINNSKIQFIGLNMGLGYNLKFEDNWVTRFKLGYSPLNSMEITNEEGKSIRDLETDQSIFLQVSISFNLNKRNNEN